VARWIAVLLALFVAGYCYWTGRAIARPPGVLAPNEPEQENVADGPHWDVDGYDVHGLARFSLEARVLSAERYRVGREADLSPVDLALGWGPMSSNEVIDRLTISQSSRFYFYTWASQSDLVIPAGEIIRHSANMHMLPLDSAARETLLSARRGNLVRLSGWLVEARGKDGWRWRSSLSRSDTGAGACELVAVERVELE
jgi:hypothetical protein